MGIRILFKWRPEKRKLVIDQTFYLWGAGHAKSTAMDVRNRSHEAMGNRLGRTSRATKARPACVRSTGGGFLEKVDADRLDDYDPHFMLFKPADVEAFEHENEWLLVSAAQQVEQSLASNLTDKEKRRLGQLLREKVKWDKSLEAAVHIGLFCAQLNHHITRAELEDEIYKIDPDLPNTTVDRIWRAIPEQHRKAAGRPKKK